MTIRRNVDISAINSDYMALELACELAPQGMFEQARDMLFMIGTQCDALLGTAQAMGLSVCHCDGIREIEVLMFDMLRRKNPGSQIEQAIGLGRILEAAPNDSLCLHGSRQDILNRLQRDRDFLLAIDDDDSVERAAQIAAGL